MSDRGSFVTQFIYCPKCAEAALKVLSECETATVHDGAIIAGHISGLYSGEEIDLMEFDILWKMEKVICHPVRVAVLAEKGERIFNVEPKDDTDD